jgi:hypothetical protein
LGITKGQEAVVKGWVSRQIPNWPGRMCLETLFVELLNPRRPVHLPYLPKNIVPLTRESTAITAILPSDAEINITRQQIPILLNFAMTDYTSQGKTRPVNVVDMMNCKNHQAMYTCLSRGKSARHTAILRDFKEKKVTGGLDGWLREEFRDLDTLSDITHLQYAGKLPPGIVQRLRTSTLKVFKQVYGSGFEMARLLQGPSANSQGSRTSVAVPVTENEAHTAQGYVSQQETVEIQPRLVQAAAQNQEVSVAEAVVGRKRKTGGGNEGGSKRVRGAGAELPVLRLPYSWTWDNVNWSCAFDSYLTLVYHIMLRDVDKWMTIFNGQGPLMREVVQALDSMRKRECSKIGARERIRQRFWDLDDECFPRGPYGSDIFALAQMLQGVRIENAVVEPARTCLVCQQQCAGELFEAIGPYTMLRNADPPNPSISASLLALERNAAGVCALCQGAVYTNNIYPPLICIQIPLDSVRRSRKTPGMLIDTHLELREKNYVLAGVVYWSGIDAHFETRTITSDGQVHRYDGMKSDGELKLDGKVYKGCRTEWLSTLDHRQAVLALYVDEI